MFLKDLKALQDMEIFLPNFILDTQTKVYNKEATSNPHSIWWIIGQVLLVMEWIQILKDLKENKVVFLLEIHILPFIMEDKDLLLMGVSKVEVT